VGNLELGGRPVSWTGGMVEVDMAITEAESTEEQAARGGVGPRICSLVVPKKSKKTTIHKHFLPQIRTVRTGRREEEKDK